jgi:hypothetical protein
MNILFNMKSQIEEGSFNSYSLFHTLLLFHSRNFLKTFFYFDFVNRVFVVVISDRVYIIFSNVDEIEIIPDDE